MKVNLARSAGFCFGVKDAVDIALETASKEKKVFMLGDIVHNASVVEMIDQAGVKVIKDLSEVEGGTLLLRAHGTKPEIYEEAKRRGFKIVDATCPMVLEIHEIVKELEHEGYRIVIVGDHGHDEVVGIAGQVRYPIVVSNPEEAKAISRIRKMGVVVQSTQNIDNVSRIISQLVYKCREMKFINTICGPTIAHQNEIRKMPLENDVMIIVGSFTSANTCRLTQISRELNPRTYQVETADDVKAEWFENAESVGISAGASTPDWVIDEVLRRVEELTSVTELNEL
jgi:4-hydroxy-3-methylbut-2-enyl diphosphate reductase